VARVIRGLRKARDLVLRRPSAFPNVLLASRTRLNNLEELEQIEPVVGAAGIRQRLGNQWIRIRQSQKEPALRCRRCTWRRSVLVGYDARPRIEPNRWASNSPVLHRPVVQQRGKASLGGVSPVGMRPPCLLLDCCQSVANHVGPNRVCIGPSPVRVGPRFSGKVAAPLRKPATGAGVRGGREYLTLRSGTSAALP